MSTVNMREKIANQFFLSRISFDDSISSFFCVRRYMNITSLTSSSIKFFISCSSAERWFLSDFSSLWFCFFLHRRFCLILNAILCWRCLTFCMIWLMLSMLLCCYHRLCRCHHRHHYRCHSTLLSYRSIESKLRTFTNARPHDMHNISQPLTIHFISFINLFYMYKHLYRCHYLDKNDFISAILLSPRKNRENEKHCIQAYIALHIKVNAKLAK